MIRKGNGFDIGVPGDQRLKDAISQRTPNAFGATITHVHGSTIITPHRKGPRTPSCPFGSLYVADATRKLRGGVVSSVAENITVEDFDIGTDPLEDGLRFWLKISFTGLVDSGVLLMGGTLTAAEIDFGDSLPANDPCTKDAPAGTYYIDLGDCLNNRFRKSACGNITSFTQCKGLPGWARGV